MSAAILAFMEIVSMAMKFAPGAFDVVEKARKVIDAFFSSGAITKEAQLAMHGHVNAILAAHESGDEPPHWKVEPDPVTVD